MSSPKQVKKYISYTKECKKVDRQLMTRWRRTFVPRSDDTEEAEVHL